MIRTLILWGAITWYAGPYVGEPLRCGSVDGASPLYDTTHAWIAVDTDAYGWRCNDLVRVTVGDEEMLLRVKDSGPLSAYCVYFGDTCIEIVGDLPFHVWPGGNALSALGSVENVTAGLRQILEVER